MLLSGLLRGSFTLMFPFGVAFDAAKMSYIVLGLKVLGFR